MKNLFYTTLTAVLVTAAPALVCAGYDGKIHDDNQWDSWNLVQLFNQYFRDQGMSYTSSDELYQDLGVQSITNWTTHGSSVVGAFKVAAFQHTLSVIGSNGQNLGSIYTVESNTNLGEGVGIVDIEGGFQLADGQNISFQLAAGIPSTVYDYTWSSDGENNPDGRTHMITFDVTDLYNAKNGTDFTSVYMMGWEDMPDGNAWTDWDYQDSVYFVTNLEPTDDRQHNHYETPEPATLFIFGLGIVGAAVARRYRKK
ncbi:MAG: PEP-CTERM sorting domain-containing protein [Planctomycetaceae bacterium]|jgi:hypothetical protein|nr:PEP-CTERM sorting domain-containing protein [Planctomycetaceae bacterium]